MRIIVGTLIKIGNGKLEAENIKDIIEEGNRKKQECAYRQNGLILEKVFY